MSQHQETAARNSGLSSEYVAKTLTRTSVYTVSNSNNEFVLISDPNSAKSIGLLCFCKEDADAFLAQPGNASRSSVLIHRGMPRRIMLAENDRDEGPWHRISFN
ncbi:hypothetical protein P3S67_017352 [Capsicum chacoense]